MSKLVSIIIPCYNDGDYIEQAVQSILDQSYTNKEIIIIDDGSNHKTKAVLKKLTQKIDLLITIENKGPSVARNRGVTEAKGEFILTLDADDFFEPTFIQKAVNILNSSPKVGLVTCHAHLFDENANQGEIISRGGEAKDLLFRNGALASSLFRKKSWRDVQGYDEKMLNGYEDWDFNISIVKAGWSIYVIEEYLFHYRLKEKSRNSTANFSHKYDLIAYIYIKHKDIFTNNYEENIRSIFLRMEQLEKEKLKLKNTFTYKFGDAALRPFKFIFKK
ncbi:glycosyltransferase family 2 protein [Gillisia limnaea]|uniref:Glycosyl transferase family 2 n=1 Tax=Gillisia limnaea (strain DSM 15749 / LMG 21470 / R-8282) TaxID=865937 RepID=H2BV82_GILLR|nr:glycosyltransferase family A protein [Gillisia limnaea]EHQ01747.1 glycosyl transferase family 2 [Gillisia limnaea DSM 15749]